MSYRTVTKSDSVIGKSIHTFTEGVLTCLPYLTVKSLLQPSASDSARPLQERPQQQANTSDRVPVERASRVK